MQRNTTAAESAGLGNPPSGYRQEILPQGTISETAALAADTSTRGIQAPVLRSNCTYEVLARISGFTKHSSTVRT